MSKEKEWKAVGKGMIRLPVKWICWQIERKMTFLGSKTIACLKIFNRTQNCQPNFWETVAFANSTEKINHFAEHIARNFAKIASKFFPIRSESLIWTLGITLTEKRPQAQHSETQLPARCWRSAHTCHTSTGRHDRIQWIQSDAGGEYTCTVVGSSEVTGSTNGLTQSVVSPPLPTQLI